MQKLTFKALLQAARMCRLAGNSIHDTMLILHGIKTGVIYYRI